MLFLHIRSIKQNKTELSSVYDTVVDAIRDTVEQVTDQVSANEARTAILNMTHVFDSKLRGSILLNEKCKKLGLKFNKASNLYEPAA